MQKSILKVFPIILVLISVSSIQGALKFTNRPQVTIAQIEDKMSDNLVKDSDQWFGPFLDAYLNFRIGVSSNYDLISIQKIKNDFNHGEVFNKESIKKGGKANNIDHYFLQSFYFTSHSEINFYGEYLSKDGESKVYEKIINTQYLSESVDSIALWFLKEANLFEDDKELNRFFKMKVIPDDIKEVIKTGEILNISQNSDSLKLLKTINSLHEAAARDPKNLLASYSASKLYEQAGNYSMAAKEQNDLLTIIPFYAPLYSKVVKNFRITGNSQKALTFAANAEKKGIVNPELLLEGAITLEEMGIDRQASRAFFSILKLDPHQKRALLYFARASNRERRPKNALTYTDSILKLDSNFGEALLESGRAKMLLGEFDAAKIDLKKSTALITKPFQAMSLLGEINVLQENYEKGALFFENAIKNGASSVKPYLNGAKAWQLDKNLNKAFTLLQNAYNLYSENPEIKKAFSLISFTLKDSSEALELFEDYTKKFKQDPEILFPMGDIYTSQKNFKKAFFCFNQASQLTEDKSFANLKLGMFYLKKGDYIPAEKYLTERLSKVENDPIALSYLGTVKLKTGKNSEALDNFVKAREMGYEGTFCTEQIGLIHFKSGNHQKAFTELSKLENVTTNISDLFYRLAVSALYLKESEKAMEYLQFASNNERASPDILLNIADGFKGISRPEKAIDVLTQAINVYPKNPDILIELSSLLEEEQRFGESALHLVSLYNTNNSKYGMHYAKAGFLYEKSGEKDKAIDVFNGFLSKGYKNDKVTKHLAALEFSNSNFKKTVALLTQPDINLRKTENKQILGESLYFLGNYGEALPYLLEIADLKKECPHCLANLAATYDALKMSDKAIIFYNKAIPLSSDEEAAGYANRIARIQLNDGNVELAEKSFRFNILNYPKDLRNYDALTKIYEEQREWGYAVEIIKLALKLEDITPYYLKKLASFHKKQNNRAEEESILKQYIKINPNDDEALISLSEVNYDRELFAKAASFLNLAEAQKELSSNNSHKAGLAYLKSDDTKNATIYFKKAIKRGDSTSRNFKNLVTCYRTDRDTSNLTKTLNKLLNSGIRDYETLKELGIILTEGDSINSGIALLEEASSIEKKNAELHLRLSKLYDKIGNEALLKKHLEQALTHSKENAEILTFAGTYYRKRGNSEEAQKHIRKALSINSEYGEALFEMGLYLYINSKYDSAVVYTEKAVEKATYIEDAYTTHALTLHKLNRHTDAIKVITRALKSDSTNLNTLIAAGRIFFGAQNNDIAKNYLIKAITISPLDIECFELMGDIYVHESSGSKAAEFYRKAIKVSGFNEKILMKLGDVLLTINENLQAQRVYSSILKKNNESKEARFKLVLATIKSRDLSGALKIFEKFPHSDQKEMWQLLTKGLTQIALNEIEPAFTSLSIAYKLGPEKAITNTMLANVMVLKNQLDEAISHLEKSINIDPFNPFSLLLLGQAYEKKGDLSTAFNIYKKVSDKYSMIPETYNYLASLRSKESKHDSAVAVIELGLKVDPENGDLYLALGRELKLTGKKTESLNAYKKSIKLSKQDKEIYLEIAKLLYKDLNDSKNALKYVKRYLKSGGSKEKVKEAKLSDLLI